MRRSRGMRGRADTWGARSRAIRGASQGPVLGRDRERERIDRLLARPRAGHGGALATVGDPGVGKTRLLEEARTRADGMVVLHCQGLEVAGSELTFAALQELLEPILDRLDRI